MEELFDDLLNNTLLLDSDELPIDDKELDNVCKENVQETLAKEGCSDNTNHCTNQMQEEVINENQFAGIPADYPKICTENTSTNSTIIKSINEEYKDVPIAVPAGDVAQIDESATLPSIVKLPTNCINPTSEVIAVPLNGHQHCFQLIKVCPNFDESIPQHEKTSIDDNIFQKQRNDYYNVRYTRPYDNNFTWEYISVRKHILSEHISKFENLRSTSVNNELSDCVDVKKVNFHGFMLKQYQLFHQQLRIHVQLLTQTCLQTHFHPELWRLSVKSKDLLKELQECNIQIYNLKDAFNLIEQWEKILKKDTPENKEMMEFVHQEIELT